MSAFGSTAGREFTPNPGAQITAWHSTAPEVLMSSMYGRGKSRLLCEKLDYTARRYPRCDLLLGRKKREDLGNTTLATLLNEVIDPDLRAWGWRISADGGSALNYPNGSRIVAMGIDRSGKVKSGAYLKAAVDQSEELEENEYDDLAGRLRQWRDEWRWYDYRSGVWREPVQQLISACNPEGPTHFLYRRFEPHLGSHIIRTNAPTTLPNGAIVPAGTALREVICSEIADNTQNLSQSYLMRLEQMTGVYRERNVLGKWVAFEGAVFRDWGHPSHLIDRPRSWDKWGGFPPPTWDRVVGIDLGYENPFSAQWCAISPDGHWFRYREIYRSWRTIDDHAKDMARLEREELEALRRCAKDAGGDTLRDFADYLEALNVVLRPCDHDRGERKMLEKGGIWTTPANKEIEAGLQTLMRMMDPTQPGGAHLHVVRGACVEVDDRLAGASQPTCLEEEMPLYRWAKRSTGEMAGLTKDLPVDKFNHAIDAMRYAVHSYASRARVAIYGG